MLQANHAWHTRVMGGQTWVVELARAQLLDVPSRVPYFLIQCGGTFVWGWQLTGKRLYPVAIPVVNIVSTACRPRRALIAADACSEHKEPPAHEKSADKLRHDATKPRPLTSPWQRHGQHSWSDAPEKFPVRCGA